MLCIMCEREIVKKISESGNNIEGIKWFSKEEIKELLEKNLVDWHGRKAFEIL